MNFHFVPSLEHMANVSIAKRLYEDLYIKDMFAGEVVMDILLPIPKWDRIEMMITEKMSPYLTQSMVKNLIMSVSHLYSETLSWKGDHDCVISHNFMYPDYRKNVRFCWRSNGTIDRTLTAKKIVVNENVDERIRFILACIYFLEEDILALWENIKSGCDFSNMNINLAVSFWMSWLEEGSIQPWRQVVNKYFKVRRLNPSGLPLRLSSFYPFLSLENKLEWVSFLGKSYLHADDISSCLPKIEERERIEMLRSDNSYLSFRILRLCLNWPFQCLFVEVAKELMGFFTARTYTIILFHFISDVLYGEMEDIQLFEEFWNLSPEVLKEAVKQDRNFMESVELELTKCYGSLPCIELIAKIFHLNEH